MVETLFCLNDLKLLIGRKVNATTEYGFWTSLFETTYAIQTGLQRSHTSAERETNRVSYVFRKSQNQRLLSVREQYSRP